MSAVDSASSAAVDATAVVAGGTPSERRSVARELRRSPLRPAVLEAGDVGDVAREGPSWTLPDGRRAALLVNITGACATSFLGVVAPERPNEFTIAPDDSGALDYVRAALAEFVVSDAREMVVREPIQANWLRKQHHRPPRRRRPPQFRVADFNFRGPEEDDNDVVDCVATLTFHDSPVRSRVLLQGHLDPLDGRYHWAGTAFAPQARTWKEADRAKTLSVEIDGVRADARITEVTPWGAVRLVGVGAPPYALG